MQTGLTKMEKGKADYDNELEQVIATRNRFFAIVSHDVKGPFGNIVHMVHMLKDPANRTDELVAMLTRASEQTYNLLENLLTWSRSQRGLLRYEPTTVILHRQVADCLNLYAVQAAEKGIELHNSCPDELQATADVNMLQSVLRNLISNAIKFTKPGGHVTIAATEAGRMVEITVNDTGIGMPEAILKSLLSEEKTVSRAGTGGERGTGLGLILCQEFVERHGGALSVKSVAGQGSSFTFTLPAPIS